MATVTGLTAARVLELLELRVPAESKTVTTTAQALTAGATANGVLLLGRAYRIDKVVVNKACRLRLYAGSVYRTADADRLRSVDPQGDHGLITELIFTPDMLSLLLLPAPQGWVASGTTYYSVTNDGTTGDVTATFTEQILEA